MSFLIVGSDKGRYNMDELFTEIESWGEENPQNVITETIKKRKMLFKGFRIMLLE